MLRTSVIISLFSLLAAKATATAIPSSLEPHCDGNYLVEKWGRVVAQPSWNSTRFGLFMGCQSTALTKRDTYDTTVEPTDDSAAASYVEGTDKPYDSLWDRAVAELCGNTFCDGAKSISVESGRADQDLVLSLDGNFADSGLRDNFITLVREAFTKSITSETTSPSVPPIYTDTFVSFAHATTSYGDASGYELTMRMTDVSTAPGCPGFINTINSFGALVPGLSTVFGVAGAACAA